MRVTRELTITLPEKLAVLVDSKVSSGKFSTESDYIAASLVESLLEPISSPRAADWKSNEAARRLAAMKHGTSRELSHEEFWGQLEAEGIFDEDE